MPLPEPKSGEDEQTFVSRCIKELHETDPNRDDKQIQAMCYTKWREKKRVFATGLSEPIPILRSFESNGVKYVAGYAAIFDSEDSYGTAMTHEAVESNLERLQKFPAVRFMHRVPFGQIDFSSEILFEGQTYKTFVDDHGFHVLCRVYDDCKSEWNMVKSGKWGFSYGFLPSDDGIESRRLANGHMVPAFVKGTLYEVSVVDAPAHDNAAAYVVSRMIHGHTGGNMTNEAENMPEENKNGNKEEFERWLKDAEKRIMDNITKVLGDKQTQASMADMVDEMEKRLMATIDTRLAQHVPEKSRIDETFGKLQDVEKALNSKIQEMKGIEKALKVAGEDFKGVSERIVVLEKQRDDLVSNVTQSVQKTVEKQLTGISDRLTAIESAPDFHSPATITEGQGVQRGMGFGAMLEAARRGTQ